MSKVWFLGMVVAAVAAVAVPVVDVEAKRLGGAKSTGMQRQTPTQPAQKAPDPAQGAQPGGATPAGAGPAAAAAVPAAAAAGAKSMAPAAAAKRSWTGPLMGLAAGLGLAALFSAFGMGETFSSIMMILLLAMVGFVLFRFIMSRFGGARGARARTDGLAAAGAGAAGGNAPVDFTAAAERSASVPSPSTQGIRIGSALTPPAVGTALEPIEPAKAERWLPADFDKSAFERVAKTIFVRLQAANDDRNLDDLRLFSTPEMFAELRTDLLDRGERSQRTEVVSVNPTIVDFADEGQQRVVSVRYVGVIREEDSRPAESFDETWHLVQTDDSPAWRIGGIQINA
jgi:predicted lipid-binding transport protein (Tim44 family)